MPHKFIVGREIAPLLVKVRRSGRGAVRHGGVRSVKAVRVWRGSVRYGRSRRSRRSGCGRTGSDLVRYGQSRRLRSGAVGLGGSWSVKAVEVG